MNLSTLKTQDSQGISSPQSPSLLPPSVSSLDLPTPGQLTRSLSFFPSEEAPLRPTSTTPPMGASTSVGSLISSVSSLSLDSKVVDPQSLDSTTTLTPDYSSPDLDLALLSSLTSEAKTTGIDPWEGWRDSLISEAYVRTSTCDSCSRFARLLFLGLVDRHSFDPAPVRPAIRAAFASLSRPVPASQSLGPALIVDAGSLYTSSRPSFVSQQALTHIDALTRLGFDVRYSTSEYKLLVLPPPTAARMSTEAGCPAHVRYAGPVRKRAKTVKRDAQMEFDASLGYPGEGHDTVEMQVFEFLGDLEGNHPNIANFINVAAPLLAPALMAAPLLAAGFFGVPDAGDRKAADDIAADIGAMQPGWGVGEQVPVDGNIVAPAGYNANAVIYQDAQRLGEPYEPLPHRDFDGTLGYPGEGHASMQDLKQEAKSEAKTETKEDEKKGLDSKAPTLNSEIEKLLAQRYLVRRAAPYSQSYEACIVALAQDAPFTTKTDQLGEVTYSRQTGGMTDIPDSLFIGGGVERDVVAIPVLCQPEALNTTGATIVPGPAFLAARDLHTTGDLAAISSALRMKEETSTTGLALYVAGETGQSVSSSTDTGQMDTGLRALMYLNQANPLPSGSDSMLMGCLAEPGDSVLSLGRRNLGIVFYPYDTRENGYPAGGLQVRVCSAANFARIVGGTLIPPAGWTKDLFNAAGANGVAVIMHRLSAADPGMLMALALSKLSYPCAHFTNDRRWIRARDGNLHAGVFDQMRAANFVHVPGPLWKILIVETDIQSGQGGEIGIGPTGAVAVIDPVVNNIMGASVDIQAAHDAFLREPANTGSNEAWRTSFAGAYRYWSLVSSDSDDLACKHIASDCSAFFRPSALQRAGRVFKGMISESLGAARVDMNGIGVRDAAPADVTHMTSILTSACGVKTQNYNVALPRNYENGVGYYVSRTNAILDFALYTRMVSSATTDKTNHLLHTSSILEYYHWCLVNNGYMAALADALAQRIGISNGDYYLSGLTIPGSPSVSSGRMYQKLFNTRMNAAITAAFSVQALSMSNQSLRAHGRAAYNWHHANYAARPVTDLWREPFCRVTLDFQREQIGQLAVPYKTDTLFSIERPFQRGRTQIGGAESIISVVPSVNQSDRSTGEFAAWFARIYTTGGWTFPIAGFGGLENINWLGTLRRAGMNEFNPTSVAVTSSWTGNWAQWQARVYAIDLAIPSSDLTTVSPILPPLRYTPDAFAELALCVTQLAAPILHGKSVVTSTRATVAPGAVVTSDNGYDSLTPSLASLMGDMGK
jgi:hypothetical protein